MTDSSVSDDHFVEEFIDDCRLRNMTESSIYHYKTNVGIIADYLHRNGKCLLDLDKRVLKDILRYLKEERCVKPKTIDNYFSVLSTFNDYLVFEDYLESNVVLPFRKRYVREYKRTRRHGESKRRLISLDEMKMLIDSVMNPRDKAIIVLLAKTGVRRGELIALDMCDIDWEEQSIKLKQHAKRSNTLVFFDDETARILKRWIRIRDSYPIEDSCTALFVGQRGSRLNRNGVYYMVTRYAEMVGLHDPRSRKLEDHFTPHCFRHWFTTHLRRNGIRREILKELRGDSRGDAVDIYDHISRDEMRRAYVAHIPQLGI